MLNVVRSIARLLDRSSLSRPPPLVKDADLIAIVQHMILARGRTLFALPRLRVVPRRLTSSKVGCGRRTDWVVWRLTLLLTWVGDISRRRLWTSGALSLTLGSSGTPLCCSCIGSWLLSRGLRSTMTVEVVLRLIPWLGPVG